MKKYYVAFQAIHYVDNAYSPATHLGSFIGEAKALNEKTIESWRNDVSSRLNVPENKVIFLNIQPLDEETKEETLTASSGTRSSGIIRQIDESGRVEIPKAIRTVVGFGIEDPLELYYSPEDKTVTLKKYESEAYHENMEG